MLFLYTCGLGGFSARVEQRIRQGLIRPFRMRTRDDRDNSLSFETLQLCSKGYVPKRFLKPLEGEVEEGVQMVPPIQVRFKQTCGKCGSLLRDTAVQALLKTGACPTCKTTVPLANTQVERYVRQTAGFEQIGTFAYDDLTSASDWLLQDMSHRKLGGEKDALGAEIQSGDLSFRGNNRAQVGMAQTRVHELVANSLSIPNLVLLPVWTAISHESSDDTGRLTVIGPKLAGDAKTYIAPSWFGNTLEAVVVEGSKPGEKIRRLYLDTFVDEYNRRHLCGHRGDPRFMAGSLEDAPYSDNEPPKTYCDGFSLNTFFRMLTASVQQGLDADAASGMAMPGIESIPGTYGDTDVAEPVAARPAAAGRVRPGTVRTRPQPAATPAPEPVAEPVAPTPAEELDLGPVVPVEALAPAEPVSEPTPAAPVAAAPAPAAPTVRFARPAGPRPPRAPQPGPGSPAARSQGRPIGQ